MATYAILLSTAGITNLLLPLLLLLLYPPAAHSGITTDKCFSGNYNASQGCKAEPLKLPSPAAGCSLPLESKKMKQLPVEDEDDELYVLDPQSPRDGPNPLRPARILTAGDAIRKGVHCNTTVNICDGVIANKGKDLLHCCKTHCRNILSDRNNCGTCYKKCKFGQLCCGGTCTSVGFSASHCGKCNHSCPEGVRCSNGLCGYA